MKSLETHSLLIDIFLLDMPIEILDISYDYDFEKINIQIVTISEDFNSNFYRKRLKSFFPNCAIIIKAILVDKETYNRNSGEWLPSGFSWLKYVLFSKAEIL